MCEAVVVGESSSQDGLSEVMFGGKQKGFLDSKTTNFGLNMEFFLNHQPYQAQHKMKEPGI